MPPKKKSAAAPAAAAAAAKDSAAAAAPAVRPAKPARVVLVKLESLRADAPEKIDLPHLQALAAEGTLFRRCVMTLPTRIQRDPVFGAVIPNMTIPSGTILWKKIEYLAEVLGESGRETIQVAAFPAYKCVNAGCRRSWFKNYPDLIVIFRAFEWIEEHDPIFTMVHPQDLMLGGAEGAVPPGETLYSPNSVYRRLAARQDEALGFLVKHLKRVGKWDDTLLVVVGDHGLALKGGGHPPLDPESWFSPLLFAGPGVRRGVLAAQAECLDIAPTVAHLMGVRAPKGSIGRILGEALEAPPPGAPTKGEPRLLALNELCRDFAAALEKSKKPAEVLAQLKRDFKGVENFPEWGDFATLEALLEHNRKVYGELVA